MTVRLIKYDAACRALAEAKRVDEVKAIHNTAKMMAAYARIAKNEKMKQDAADIRERAEHRLGVLMDLQAKTAGKAKGSDRGGRRKFDGSRRDPTNTPPTLAEAGIDKHLADRARKAFKGEAKTTTPEKKKKLNGKPAGWRSILAHDGEDSVTPATDTPTAFLARTGLAFEYAVYEGKEVNQAMVDAARAVVEQWADLAVRLEQTLVRPEPDTLAANA